MDTGNGQGTKLDILISKIDNLVLEDFEYENLLAIHTAIRNKRSEFEKKASALKEKERKIEFAISEKLKSAKLQSIKTKFGRAGFKISNHVITNDRQTFISWLIENPQHMDILKSDPYNQKRVKELVTDEAQTLPPGLEWFREQKLSITKG